MTGYALAIDIGTTSVKAVLLSRDKRIVTECSRSHDLLSLHTGWAEERAEDWWNNTRDCIREITGDHPDMAREIRVVGISGMVPAIVLLDGEGGVLRNTIQQNDARSVPQITRLQEEIDQDELYRLTGGKTNQQHILPRLLWVKENEPEVWSRVRWVMGSYDYVAWLLTGVPSIEVNWAVESGAWNIHSREWLGEQFETYGLDPEWFPEVRDSMAMLGDVAEEWQRELGLPPVPVIAGSADHVASTLAAGIVEPGDLLIKFGGAGDILYCTDTLKTSEQLFIDYHIVPGRYLLNGCMAASGSLVKWYVKEMLDRAEEPGIFAALDREAEAVPPASDGLIILPYFLGEKTPIFDPEARGVLYGLTLSHTRGHIFRAVLEAVIYGFRHHLDVLKEMGLKPGRIYATNGGAKSSFWCQIAADVLGQPVTSFPHHPGSSLGVGFLAGMAVGLYSEWDEILEFLQKARAYEPQAENKVIYDRAYGIYRDLYRRLGPCYEATSKLYI